MCGIAGIFDFGGEALITENDMRRMLAMIRHRGPDQFGIYLDQQGGSGQRPA